VSRARADALLLIVAVIWGTAFVAQKAGNEAMGPLGFVGARFLLSFLALAPFAALEALRPDRARLTRSDVMLAAGIGLCLFVGAALQQAGLASTSAGNGGFLTSLYVLFVPFIAWLLGGGRPRRMVLFACALSVVGAWLLTARGALQRFSEGDALVSIAVVAFALAIVLVPLFLERAARPFFLAFAQYGVAGALGLAGGSGFETLSLDAAAAVLPALLYTGLVSGGVAYTLQIVAQKHTPPAEAALIMSLESVFAALAGAALLSERLTPAALVGCALILVGVVAVEIGPARGESEHGRRGGDP